MKLSAKKMGSMKTLKDSLKKGGSGGNFKTYIKNIPADGLTVRFLTEPEDWFGYYEYWDDTARTFVPMAEGEVLPDGAKASFRYLANALDVENDRVIPLKLAKTAANVLILKYDKYDTMMDRNYELQKHGEGLDTTYDVTPDAPSKLNLSKYDMLDLEQILIDARAEATGETTESSADDDEDEKPVAKKQSAKPKGNVVSAGSAVAEADIDEDEDEDEDSEGGVDEDALFPNAEYRTDYSDEELNYIKDNLPDDYEGLLEWWGLDTTGKKKDTIGALKKLQDEYNFADAGNSADEDEDDEDEEAEEDSDADESDDEEEVEYDEDALRGMTIRELRLIAEDLSIEFDKGATKNTLVDLIIEAAEA